jgi:dsDNA-specific endonuclease/ATPase MutS2
MSNFWIGDWVRNTQTGKIGVFEGCEKNTDRKARARVKIRQKIYLMPMSRLELLSEKEVEAARVNERTRPMKKKSGNGQKPGKPFADTLDLHIEKLAPHLVGKQVELILKKQLEAATIYMEEAISRRQFQVTIIHGKGTGALKMEIYHLLEDYTEVFFTREVHNGGAVEVLFRYL